MGWALNRTGRGEGGWMGRKAKTSQHLTRGGAGRKNISTSHMLTGMQCYFAGLMHAPVSQVFQHVKGISSRVVVVLHIVSLVKIQVNHLATNLVKYLAKSLVRVLHFHEFFHVYQMCLPSDRT